MKIETTRRRVHVEVIDHTQVRITNAFRQVVFNMDRMAKDNIKIDLISLSLVESPTKFLAFVYSGKGIVGNPYVLHVSLYNPSSSYGYGVVDRFMIGGKREGTVEVTVVE